MPVETATLMPGSNSSLADGGAPTTLFHRGQGLLSEGAKPLHGMTRTTKRMLLAAALITAGLLLAGVSSRHGQEARAVDRTPAASNSSNTLADRFARLSHAHTNRC